MDTWIYVISILASLFLGVKMKSKCFSKNCECSIEKAETDNEILRSIRIGRKSKVIPTNNETIS